MLHYAPLLRGTVARFVIPLFLSLTLLACSSSDEGGSGTDPNTAGGAGCTGAFCLEDDIRLAFEPDKLVFVDSAAGSTTTLEVTVRHVGNRGDLELKTAKLTQSSGEFSLIDFSPLTLQPGGTVKLKVRYAPKAEGAKTAKLTVTNNATLLSMQEAVLPIVVKKGSGNLKAVPDPVDFGAVPSTQSSKKSVQLYNNGSNKLTVDKLELDPNGSADFTITKAPKAPFDIEPSASAEVEITFNPTAGGADATALLVQYDGDRKAQVDVYAKEIGPKIQVVPPKLLFGTMDKGDTVTKQLKIYSNGLAALHVKEIALSLLSKVKTVKISEPGPFKLEPGESKLIDVTLTLDQEVAKTSTAVAGLQISSDAPGMTLVNVPLEVTGKPCKASESSEDIVAEASGGQVDIIVAIDTSGSMKDEAKAVQANLNLFAQIIGGKNIDYHVILLADGFGLCVPPPLGGKGCADTAQYRHVKVKVDSTDALKVFIYNYAKFQGFLRAGAAKHIVVVSDDKSDKDASWFTSKVAQLQNPSWPDGFTFHSIASYHPTLALLPCFGGAGWGGVYLDLSKQTGGEVAQICSADWTNVFKAIGNNVVKTVKVQCSYSLPKSKDGKPVDPTKIAVSWSSGGGAKKPITRVDSADKCVKGQVGWHFDNAAKPTAAILCPETCDAMKDKKIHFQFGC
ncbi:MAG: choice-of-anchor D domain-containing protein [Myxococcales bacterium]|nr:choice-of-anchor D domain-containing protein [Myxococcales bacterium]